MRHRICASGIAVLLVWTSLAGAQARDPAVAEALYKAGREAVTRGDYVTACPKFEQSQQLDPGDGTLFNLANCEEHLSRFVSASRHWREAAEMLPPTDPRRQAAQDKAAAAEARAAKLVIRLVSSSPPGSAVKLDDAEVASAGLGAPLLVDPGRHVLLARAPRYEERPYVIVLSEGELKEVVVAPGPELTPALTTSPPAAAPALISSPAPDVGSRTPAPRPRSFLEQHRWSMIGAGVAAGLAGVGLGLGIATLPHHTSFIDACQRSSASDDCLSRQSAVAREALAANVLFGVAGAVAVGSTVMFFTVEREKKGPSVAVAPRVGGMTVLVQY